MAALFRKILSPVYFDETSPVALEYARHFARQNDGTVYLLHVVPSDELHLLRKVYRPEEGGGADTSWAQKVAREKLQTMAQEHLPGVRCEIITHLSSGPAVGILEVENALGADLVVITTHGRTGIAHLILGSIAEKVVRESQCPVFTSHRGEKLATAEPFQRVLVPVDIAERSVTALTYARAIAEHSKGTVYPLHIVPTEETDLLLRDVYQAREGTRANLVVAEKVTRQKLQELAQTHLSGVRYEPVVHVSGDPARTILEVERDVRADLIVMATHGFTGLFHLMLGSLTEKMMREASCPVLSLRQPPEGPHRPEAAEQR
ncbi:MAG TPA: universal stress protein [Candidatus Binatia bacterium]|nr:universal stress protein [Candidatus Binatia bacterium]